MKAYGLQMVGDFFIEAIDTKPSWTEAYIGRFIYTEDTDSYWLGGLKDWIQLGYGKSIIDEYSLNFGFGYRQINSQSIPFKHSFIAGSNIFEGLVAISSGVGLSDLSIDGRHLKLGQIKAKHINWSLTDGFVNASCIPINSFFIDSNTPTEMSVQDAITQLESSAIKISRVTVQSTAWVFSPADSLYRTTIVVLPITTSPIIIQRFLENGEMIIPDKIELDSGTNRVYVWYKSAVLLKVVMVG